MMQTFCFCLMTVLPLENSRSKYYTTDRVIFYK